MEVKVSVDGVQRVVCGVTEDTTCHEVVVVLAQSMGQPGRYTLREKFKDFERCMMPNEHLLETLGKYGEQAREVQLTLLLNGPSASNEMSRASVGRYQPCPPLRRKDAGARMRRGSSSLILHRRSLPALPSPEPTVEEMKEEVKRPKRKSLTFMEEAWEWLDSLGKGKSYSTARDKEMSKKTEKRSHSFLNISCALDKDVMGRSSRSKVKGQRGSMSDLDHQTSCCIGSQPRSKTSKNSKKIQESKYDDLSSFTSEDEKNSLKERVLNQLSCLQDLEIQISRVDKQILDLEEKQRVQMDQEEAQQRTAELEKEQVKFWEKELKATEVQEKELQRQFLNMREKFVTCKSRLEEYRLAKQGLDFFVVQSVEVEESETVSEAVTEFSEKDANQQQSDPDGEGHVNRKFQPMDVCRSPRALVPPNQNKERRPTGPTELREWWTRWSEAQNTHIHTEKKVIHRSELTIYLASTKI